MADLSKLDQEIKKVQESFTKDSNTVVDKPLTITVKKHNYVDLTLIDLPGLTYKDGLGERIRDIINVYIKPETAIIVNVQACTADLTTS